MWERAGELGLLGVQTPEADGGPGGTAYHAAITNEEQIYAGASGFGLTVHSGEPGATTRACLCARACACACVVASTHTARTPTILLGDRFIGCRYYFPLAPVQTSCCHTS